MKKLFSIQRIFIQVKVRFKHCRFAGAAWSKNLKLSSKKNISLKQLIAPLVLSSDIAKTNKNCFDKFALKFKNKSFFEHFELWKIDWHNPDKI